MTQRRRTATVGTVCAVLGLLGGAFSTWAATDRKLAVHIARAAVRVEMMCQLAEFQMSATEAQCRHLGATCPERPPALRREVLTSVCKE